ncbi:hypothetical protein [uncultured Bacteroides sp.]|nr:hypothetical protein [uncultured Bacteroides sp.]
MKNLFSTSLFILANILLLLTGCKEDELPSSGEGGDIQSLPIKLTETDYTSDNTYYLLNDDEPPEVYFDKSQRSFYVNQPLQISLDDEQCFLLRFYSPREISNVTVWATIEGYEEDFKFIELEKVMPFQQLKIQIPFATQDLTAYTRTGKKIKIMQNPYLTAENITLKVECQDPYYKKLQAIRCTWRISFSDYSGYHWNPQYYKYKLLAPHAREAVALALNMSYMYSSERFEKALHEFGPLHSDNNKTEIDKDALLKKVIAYRGLSFGHCSGVNGVGQGGTEMYCLNEWCFLEHYVDDSFETHTVFHEFGHNLGYVHTGNMSYEITGPGWITLCANVYRDMSLDKDLPVYSRRFMHTRKNTNRYDHTNYYRASKYVIEGAELDAIDGGLSPWRGETDPGGNEGSPVSLKLDASDVPNATATTFRPKDVYVYGDTMYVVNDAAGHFSLEIFSIANDQKTHLESIMEWTENNETNTFSRQPNGVFRANGKIYVTHEGSRTEIFDARTKGHPFITCIGNGNWGTGPTQTIHAFDVSLYKGIIIIHDKRYMNFVEERLIQPGTLPLIYARSENLGETNGTYGIAVDDRSGLLYTTHPNKRIDVFKPDDMREGTAPKRIRQIACKNTPYALDFYQGRLFVSSNGTEKFCEVNPDTGDIIKDYTVIEDITLQAPEKFCIRRNTLFITDRTKEGACVYAIPMNKLK